LLAAGTTGCCSCGICGSGRVTTGATRGTAAAAAGFGRENIPANADAGNRIDSISEKVIHCYKIALTVRIQTLN